MNINSKEKILIILGPTATGKSHLSLFLAHRFDCEIISADSMQVYRGMDIGTGKLSPREQACVPHYLMDIVDPEHPFSVADFQRLADLYIGKIVAKGKLPMICGGTGLYINSLVFPYNFTAKANTDPEIRERLQAEIAEEGLESLYRRLIAIDPVTAQKISCHDSRRLIRALEVYELSGQIPSELVASNAPVKYQPIMIGLTTSRQRLYQLIELRIDRMLEQGLIEEVQGLLSAGISRNAVSMQGLGYKQIAAYLEGETSLNQAVALLKRDTRRFAKRQITWFKRDPRICWFNIDQYLEEGELVNAVSFRIAQLLEEA